MKNRTKIVLSLLITINIGFLLGITYQKNFNQKDTIDTQDYFSKKQDCEKYKTDITKKLQEMDIFVAKTKTETSNTLDRIFYSPKINSCLYTAKEIMFVDGKIYTETQTLTDALTGKLLLAGLIEVEAKDYLLQKNKFENSVKEYE